jgi:hypothetical protein
LDTLTNTTSTDTEPKTKESSLVDLAYLSLTELESQVVPLFPNETDPEGEFHSILLSAVLFRMFSQGWKKRDLLDFVNSDLDDAIDLLKEIEKEERANCYGSLCS